jgi:hypothetical protein
MRFNRNITDLIKPPRNPLFSSNPHSFVATSIDPLPFISSFWRFTSCVHKSPNPHASSRLPLLLIMEPKIVSISCQCQQMGSRKRCSNSNLLSIQDSCKLHLFLIFYCFFKKNYFFYFFSLFFSHSTKILVFFPDTTTLPQYREGSWKSRPNVGR